MKPVGVLRMRKPVAALSPSVSIDFENAAYSINGVSKTLAETVEENLTWGDFDPSDVIAATGLRVTSSSPGSVYIFKGPVLTAAARSAALAGGVNAGFTAVFTYSVSHTGSGRASILCESLQSDFSSSWGFQGAWDGSGNNHAIYDYGSISDAVSVAAPGAHKAAVTLCSARLSASVDGGTVVTHATPQTNSGADLLVLGASVLINGGSSGPSTALLKRVDFYSTVADAALPGMSV